MTTDEAILKELKGIKSTLTAIAIHTGAISDPFCKTVKIGMSEHKSSMDDLDRRLDESMGNVTTEWPRFETVDKA